MNVENNYWGTVDEGIIQERIYDWFENVNLGFADYSPFLVTPDTTAPISPPGNVSKIDNGGSINIAWSPNPESDLAGYKVYWKPKNPWSFYNVIDVGNVPYYTLSGVSIDDTIAVTAYDNSMDGIDDQFDGNESWFTFDQNYYNTSLKKIEEEVSFLLFPNPTSGVFNLFINDMESSRIIISNIFGQIIFNSYGESAGIQQINLSAFPSGLYFLSVESAGRFSLQKLILNK